MPTLSQQILEHMRHATDPLSTRELTDALIAKARKNQHKPPTVPAVSAWLSIEVRRGRVHATNRGTRRVKYQLIDPAEAEQTAVEPRRNLHRGDAHMQPPILGQAPPSAVVEKRLGVARSQSVMRVAIEQTLAALMPDIIDRVTREAIRRYVDAFHTEQTRSTHQANI